jgi:hypothetical protein
MTLLPRALLWTRTDTAGSEHVVFDDRRGLVARGTQIAFEKVPYVCRYELHTDESWATTRFVVTTEGAGWLRTVRMERAAGRWRVTTAEQGQLSDALRQPAKGAPGHEPGIEDPDRLEDVLDVDLGGSPLTNTLPLKRLGMRSATIAAAWVLPPSLVVVRAKQTYTVLSQTSVRYASDGFQADIELDEHGYVTNYPGLATRAAQGV